MVISCWCERLGFTFFYGVFKLLHNIVRFYETKHIMCGFVIYSCLIFLVHFSCLVLLFEAGVLVADRNLVHVADCQIRGLSAARILQVVYSS